MLVLDKNGFHGGNSTKASEYFSTTFHRFSLKTIISKLSKDYSLVQALSTDGALLQLVELMELELMLKPKLESRILLKLSSMIPKNQ